MKIKVLQTSGRFLAILEQNQSIQETGGTEAEAIGKLVLRARLVEVQRTDTISSRQGSCCLR